MMESRRFLEEYIVTDIEKDPLPIKVLRNAIIKEEIPGQALHWAFDYLDQRRCPFALINILMMKLHAEVSNTEFAQCAEHSEDSVDSGNDAATRYEPLKLMRAVVKILDDICVREREDYRDSVDGVVESPDMQPNVFDVSYSNIKNTRRFMEDRMTVLPRMDRIFKLPFPIGYFAIFDGHNGPEAAAYGAAQLHQYLVQSLEHTSDIVTAVTEAFDRVDKAFVEKCLGGKIKSGSTAVLALVTEDCLIIAWVGDSQAVLAKHSETVNLVVVHKPERNDEIERIRKAGGEVFQMNGTFRVNGNLAVSRAIGDADDKLFIICEPDVKLLKLDGTEEFIILACDGLWDEITPEAAVYIVRHQVVNGIANVQVISQKLIQQAKFHGSTDNISVIVVFHEALESIKNRYLHFLDTELDISGFKKPEQIVEQIPIEKQIEQSLEGNLGLVMSMNGHGKDSEQVDFLSFGSSKESGAQLIGDEDEMKKEVEEDLSDAESDDEWQFEKPANQTVPATIISNNDTETNQVGYGAQIEQQVAQQLISSENVMFDPFSMQEADPSGPFGVSMVALDDSASETDAKPADQSVPATIISNNDTENPFNQGGSGTQIEQQLSQQLISSESVMFDPFSMQEADPSGPFDVSMVALDDSASETDAKPAEQSVPATIISNNDTEILFNQVGSGTQIEQQVAQQLISSENVIFDPFSMQETTPSGPFDVNMVALDDSAAEMGAKQSVPATIISNTDTENPFNQVSSGTQIEQQAAQQLVSSENVMFNPFSMEETVASGPFDGGMSALDDSYCTAMGTQGNDPCEPIGEDLIGAEQINVLNPFSFENSNVALSEDGCLEPEKDSNEGVDMNNTNPFDNTGNEPTIIERKSDAPFEKSVNEATIIERKSDAPFEKSVNEATIIERKSDAADKSQNDNFEANGHISPNEPQAEQKESDEKTPIKDVKSVAKIAPPAKPKADAKITSAKPKSPTKPEPTTPKSRPSLSANTTAPKKTPSKSASDTGPKPAARSPKHLDLSKVASAAKAAAGPTKPTTKPTASGTTTGIASAKTTTRPVQSARAAPTKKPAESKLEPRPATAAPAPRLRPTTSVAPSKPSVASASRAQPTSPKKPAAATGVTARPTTTRPLNVPGGSLPVKSVAGPSSATGAAAAPKPRVRMTPVATRAPGTTDLKPAEFKKLAPKPTPAMSAAKAAATKAPAARSAPTTARTAMPPKTTASTAAVGTKPGTKPTTASQRPITAPARTTSRVLPAKPTTTGTTSAAKKTDTGTAKKPTSPNKASAGSTDTKKVSKSPEKKSPEKKELIEQNGDVSDKEANVMNGINGDHEETEKQDAVKENGIHEGDVQVEPIEDLLE